MNDNFQDWFKSFLIWLGTLVIQLGYIFGEVWRKLIEISPILDAIARLLMVLILFAYTLKVWFGVELPIASSVSKRVKKIIGFKNQQMKTVNFVEDDFKSIEETVETTKTMSITLWSISKKLIKKGFDKVKKVIVAIGKFLYYNKFTLLGILSLLVIGVTVYLRIANPEFVAQFISDRELFIAWGSLLSYSAYALCGYGIEDEEAWKKRKEDKEAAKKVRELQKERTKEELRRNELIKVITKEIKKKIINPLLERIKQEVIYGKANYRPITSIYPELSLEYIKAELDYNENAINEFLKALDELAAEYGLFEERKEIQVINGIKQEVIKQVNLILEEITK